MKKGIMPIVAAVVGVIAVAAVLNRKKVAMSPIG